MYINYGTLQDFKVLDDEGIEIEDHIVIARFHHQVFPGDVVSCIFILGIFNEDFLLKVIKYFLLNFYKVIFKT